MRRPIGAPAGSRSTSSVTACLAASRRVPPLPASLFIDFDESRTIRARLRVSVAWPEAVAGSTNSAAATANRTRTRVRLLLAAFATGDVAHQVRQGAGDVVAHRGGGHGGDDHRDDEQHADVLGRGLAARTHEGTDQALGHGKSTLRRAGPRRQGPETHLRVGQRSQTRVGPAGLPTGPGTATL